MLPFLSRSDEPPPHSCVTLGATEAKGTTNALNVRLKPIEKFNLPHSANFTSVGVAQGVLYIDFGFIEPALLGAIDRTAKDVQAVPNTIDGQLVTRVAMGAEVLARLHQQIQQVLVGMRETRRVGSRDGK